MIFDRHHIKWFRNSSPYIDAHRGRLFVLCISDLGLQSTNLNNVVADLTLMNSLGIKLIIVYGTDQQVDDRLTVDWPSNREHRITSPEIMEAIISISGTITCDLMSRISSSNLDSPGTKNETQTVTGNFLLARPLGIIDGINHQQSGKIRRVNTEAVNYQLNGGSIVLMPTIGYSPSGEIFHLETTITASQVAQSLGADKLIYLISDEGLRNISGEIISELDLSNP